MTKDENIQWGVDWGRAGDAPCVSIIKRLPNGGIEVVAVEYGQQRPWVGLTDEEMYLNCPNWLSQEQCKVWVQQIEAKLKEKNNG